MTEPDAPPSPLGYSGTQPEEPHRGRTVPGTIAAKVSKKCTFVRLDTIATNSICTRVLIYMYFLLVFCVRSSARGAALPGGQHSGDGSDQRLEHGAAEEQQGLAAVLQRLQHPDQHPLLLRGHHTVTR